MARQHSHKAFTLLELLTVLSIIALLAAILLPAFAAAREQGRHTVCTSNLRQWGQAMAMYTSDYDAVYPPSVIEPGGVYWYENLQPDIGKVASNKSATLFCPDRDSPALFDPKIYKPWKIIGYSYNQWLSGALTFDDTSNPVGESRVEYPSITVTIYDARIGIVSMTRPDTGNNPFANGQSVHIGDVSDDVIGKLPEGARRHHGKGNYLFCDGHVSTLFAEQINSDPKSDGKHPGFGL